MIEAELRAAIVPFKVRYKGKKRAATVIGFSQNDPLGVGGGLFPDMATAYFKGGGWVLLGDLLQYYEIDGGGEHGT